MDPRYNVQGASEYSSTLMNQFGTNLCRSPLAQALEEAQRWVEDDREYLHSFVKVRLVPSCNCDIFSDFLHTSDPFLAERLHPH